MSRNVIKTVDIDAPPQKVFAVLCDVERWPEWTPTMSRVQRLDEGPFSVGSRAEVRQPKLRPAVWQVTQLEENRDFTWTTRSAGLRMKAGHLIEPSGNGSRVALSFEMSGLIAPLVARLYGSLIEEYVATESQGLKKRSEAQAP
ncbi:MAG TPA: SRPBCC family protein [Steroidobacteraceae bacterium]